MRCSVALSTYNGAAFLEKQLDSILSQTRPVDEIVISDDGSTDQTLEIIESYRMMHPFASWKILSSEQNQGFRKSFLRAIANCSGELIFLCDQDDIWISDKVERTEKIFQDNAQILSLISDFKTIDSQDNLLNPQAEAENLWVSDRVFYAKDKPAKISLREMLGRNQGQGCTMALRREIAEEYIQLGVLWTHDWILNLLAAMHGGLYYTNEQLICYRLHGSNAIGMAQGEHAQRSISVTRKLYEFLLALKYSLIQGDRNICLNELLPISLDKYEYVFDHTPSIGEAEKQQFDVWRRFQQKRLHLIENRKLISYLLFFLTNRQFFKENAYFSTYEQYVIRLMIDLCVIIKR